MMRQYLSMRMLALTLVILAACRADSQTTACTDELRVQFAPADTAILPGAAFTASVQLATCGGAQLLTDAFIWHSEDSTIASVDSLSGLVFGVALGTTRIGATGRRFGPVGTLKVSVVTEVP